MTPSLTIVGSLLLLVAICSHWWSSKKIIPISLLTSSLILLYMNGVIAMVKLVLVITIGVALYALEHHKRILLITLPLIAILWAITSTYNIIGIEDITLMSSLKINFNGAILSVILLLGIELIRDKKKIDSLQITILTWVIITAATTLSLGDHLGAIEVSPNLPLITPIWLLIHLFFFVIPQESFWRATFMVKIENMTRKDSLYPIVAPIITAICESLPYLIATQSLEYTTLTLIRSMILSLNYSTTRSIESVVVSRITTDSLQYMLFSYPEII